MPISFQVCFISVTYTIVPFGPCQHTQATSDSLNTTGSTVGMGCCFAMGQFGKNTWKKMASLMNYAVAMDTSIAQLSCCVCYLWMRTKKCNVTRYRKMFSLGWVPENHLKIIFVVFSCSRLVESEEEHLTKSNVNIYFTKKVSFAPHRTQIDCKILK